MFYLENHKEVSKLAEPDGAFSVSVSIFYNTEEKRPTRTEVIDELTQALKEEITFILVGHDTVSENGSLCYSLNVLASAKENVSVFFSINCLIIKLNMLIIPLISF